jgi:TRAP-type C4-dicarboxylate transport system substrate-binding protein
VHQQIKQIIEKNTNNNVYVKIYDKGTQGHESQLASAVRYRVMQGGLLSISNLSPMVNEVDVINIPFWAADDSDYLRLVNSAAWNKYVLSKTRAYKIKVLLHYVIGTRTATTIKHYGKTIKSPEDFAGVQYRIPNSDMLAIFYKLAKAAPQSIPWNLAAVTARHGRFQALDSSIIGLYSGPDNLKDEIAVVSEIGLVQDGWVAIANTDFIESLDQQTRGQFLDSFSAIQTAQFDAYHSAKKYCIQEFIKLGVKIYTPSRQEHIALGNAFGPANNVWTPVKTTLLGPNGVAIFDELYKAAKG